MGFRLYMGLESLEGNRIPNVAAALGNFDGVHIGHREILRQTKDAAIAIGGTSCVVTFWPHPRFVLKGLDPRLLCSFEERVELIEQAGIDCVLAFRFTRDFSSLGARQFVQQKLLAALDLKELFVGFNYHFGRGKEGNVESLSQFGKQFGFGVHVVDAVMFDGLPVSSTRIREAIVSGDVSAAAAMLGRNYSIEGPVVRGKRLGNQLGYPTANVQTKGRLLPALGVYAAWVHGVDGTPYPAAVSVGLRPTVESGATEPTLEAYIINFDGDIYGKRIRVEFVKRIRPEKKFDSIEALVEQIEQDVSEVLNVLGA